MFMTSQYLFDDFTLFCKSPILLKIYHLQDGTVMWLNSDFGGEPHTGGNTVMSAEGRGVKGGFKIDQSIYSSI